MTTCVKPSAWNNPGERESLATQFDWFEIDGKQWLLPQLWNKQGEGFRNFKCRPDDVFIITQPRSGTALTQELVWLLINNLDFETAKKFHLADRAVELPVSLFPEMWKNCRIVRPSLEDSKIFESVPVDTTKSSYEVYADLPSPRVSKTYLPISAHRNIPGSGSKMIYVLRNPKDMLISRARFDMSGSRPYYTGTFQSFIEKFISGEDNFVNAWGPYWQHVEEAYALRNHPKFLVIHYEDLITDLPAVIKKIAAFLGKIYADEQIKKLAAHLDIDASRTNPIVNKLPGGQNMFPTVIGKSKVKRWKEIFTPELEAKVDRWIEENIKETDIVFPHLRRFIRYTRAPSLVSSL